MEPGSDKSLGSGISIPNWMKQKIGDRYDLDDHTAFSPPSQDDNFFYIRYPKTTSRPPSETNYHRINKYLEKQESVASTAATTAIPGASTSMAVPAPSVSKALTGQRFPSALPLEFDPDEPPPNLSKRRGSKSLPASPLTSPSSSPKLSRKSALQNRYFTAAFPQAKPEQQGTGGYSGWLLSGLLGSREQSTAITEPLAPIEEGPSTMELLTVASEQLSLRKSASAAALRLKEEEEDEEKPKSSVSPMLHPKKVKVIKPKPSELREMNFWSPTSM